MTALERAPGGGRAPALFMSDPSGAAQQRKVFVLVEDADLVRVALCHFELGAGIGLVEDLVRNGLFAAVGQQPGRGGGIEDEQHGSSP